MNIQFDSKNEEKKINELYNNIQLFGNVGM